MTSQPARHSRAGGGNCCFPLTAVSRAERRAKAACAGALQKVACGQNREPPIPHPTDHAAPVLRRRRDSAGRSRHRRAQAADAAAPAGIATGILGPGRSQGLERRDRAAEQLVAAARAQSRAAASGAGRGAVAARQRPVRRQGLCSGRDGVRGVAANRRAARRRERARSCSIRCAGWVTRWRQPGGTKRRSRRSNVRC